MEIEKDKAVCEARKIKKEVGTAHYFLEWKPNCGDNSGEVEGVEGQEDGIERQKDCEAVEVGVEGEAVMGEAAEVGPVVGEVVMDVVVEVYLVVGEAVECDNLEGENVEAEAVECEAGEAEQGASVDMEWFNNCLDGEAGMSCE
ncbi:hypothetical protein LIER_08950 [Lithospermum erythrorhizon]|uniref:Uncharacterized protein n=1 Tax=Lithospermum erythrorhizon TaxID=34254 RepID=A0AAV3PF64_LITER